TITASGPLGADAVGIDDVRYVLAPAAVPEPGSVALLAALGLSGACVLLRRMRAPKAA
ncbi:MAG: hypothetical protein JWN14_995, partial [Chthonomonadales bacterium]|nr:hypothetical protein [Chthonomonadales bacterium]